jgi:glutathione synthase/RimK-type ligase-like ATP-grasp enzyme
VSRVLLVTCAALPDGEPGHEALDEALARRGIDAAWVVWNDPAVDWETADLVAVRSTWDYEAHLAAFLEWAEARGDRLLNGAAVFAWNTDKGYLVELAEREVPVVPTRRAGTLDEIRAALTALGTAVLKPAAGAGGRGVEILEPGGVPEPRSTGPWVVQPLVESVRTTGESSVFVIDGVAVAQVDKRPADGEIRVHETYGGASAPADLGPEQAVAALAAVDAAAARLDTEISYGRVDLLHHEGRWLVSEVELTEPGLYLDVLPTNAEPFADLVATRLDRR